MINNIMREPFGLLDASKEQDFLLDVFIDQMPFMKEALDPSVSILVGRRGSGKTALAQYFGFKTAPYELYARLDEPAVFADIITRIGTHSDTSREPPVIEHIAQLWEFAFWACLLSQAKNHPDFPSGGIIDKVFQSLRSVSPLGGHGAEVATLILRAAIEIAGGPAATLATIAEKLRAHLHSREFEAARQAIGQFLRNRSAVLVIDTLDQYDIRNTMMQSALAAMFHAVTRFSHGGKHDNLAIKCFVAQEILPYILYSGVLNVGKTFDRPVYLNWTPKSILHLLCRRLFRYLSQSYPKEVEQIGDVDWSDHHSIFEKLWFRHFPRTIDGSANPPESSFLFIQRHTQMRPRQAIWICNAIGREAQRDGTFPIMTAEQIRRGLDSVLELVAIDVINSFRAIYPNIRRIVSYLAGAPAMFRGTSFLDHVAPRTRKLWVDEEYTARLLHRLVTEVGIVGIVVKETEKYYEAEFAYNTKGYELELPDKATSVIHPMFYNMLRVQPPIKRYVLPKTAH